MPSLATAYHSYEVPVCRPFHCTVAWPPEATLVAVPICVHALPAMLYGRLNWLFASSSNPSWSGSRVLSVSVGE